MTEIFERIKAADVHRLCIPRELGGLNAPILLYFLVAEMLARGDVSVMTHHSFHGGMAMAMLVYSLNEGTTELDLGNAAHLEDPLRGGDRARSPAAKRGAAWTSPSRTPGATWPRSARSASRTAPAIGS